MAVPRIRVQPEDFVVDELPLYPASGNGGHTFVRIEKRCLDTEEVARWLAHAAGVAPREVGYAGRKDRVAVARQWLSVPGLDPAKALALRHPALRVLEALPHEHKLRTGQLRGNRFEIRVRDVDASVEERAVGNAERIRCVGMPNRFGAQRFGRDGRNVERGAAVLRGEARARDRRGARFLISALQAAVFNEVLRRRPLPLDAVESGDVARVEASGGLFLVEDVERESRRAAAFEISATGPIFGTRVIATAGEVARREVAALSTLGLPAPERLKTPRGIRLRGARRPLRVRPELAVCHRDRTLELRCTLPAGSYATVLIEELLGAYREDPQHEGEDPQHEETAVQGQAEAPRRG